MLEPGAAFGRTNPEPRVRLLQTQEPAALCLLFIPAKELDQESGEFFDCALKTLARE
jgi:hypothetical protein